MAKKQPKAAARINKESARPSAGRGGRLAATRIETPDAALNRWANERLPRIAAVLSRRPRGAGAVARGDYGPMCDDCRDLVALLPGDAPLVRKDILGRLAAMMHDDGRIARPVRGAAEPASPSDDPTNFNFIVTKYVRETGDFGVLYEMVPYHESGDSGTLYEHCMRGWQRFFLAQSERGLPLVPAGQRGQEPYVFKAPDPLAPPERVESVVLAGWAAYVLRMFMPMAEWHGFGEDVRWLRWNLERMADAANQHAWTGGGYAPALRGEDGPANEREAGEACDWSDTQAWCILGGIADAERTARCMESLEARTTVSRGRLVFRPALTRPGRRSHATRRAAARSGAGGAAQTPSLAWRLLAEAQCGRGDVALRLLKSALSTTPGTVAAAWTWHALLEGFLGVQPDLGGMLIDPCLPSAWREARVVRRWRGCRYDIRIHNPGGVQKGVREVLLDGAPVKWQTLPVPAEKGVRHKVEVVMGANV